MKERITKAVQRARAYGIDAVLITGEKNIRYFTGYTGDSAHLLICGAEAHLFTDFRYIEQAEKELSGLPGAKVHQTGRTNRWEAVFAEASVCGARRIGIDENHVTLDVYEQLKVHLKPENTVFFAGEIANIRAVKDESEIEAIRQAAAITDEAYEHLLGLIRPGVSENDLSAELKYFFNKRGLETSFPPIIISGEKTSLPHGQPSGRVVQKGDLVTMDMGCVFQGYCSDFTRTVAVGAVDCEQKAVYDVVKMAQQQALDAGKAGITAKMLDNSARQVIIDKGYGECFAHGLGHGVGLDIHEYPMVNPDSDVVLQENMVVTVEPGIYIKGRFGVRIEDLCVVQKDGLISLSAAGKQLTIL